MARTPARGRTSRAAAPSASSEKKAAPEARSTRRRRSPEEARRLILDATKTLLAQHGPDAVGLKEVAKAAGVSHALVSHYFGTYDALVEAALRDHMLETRVETLQRIADVAHAGPAEWVEMCFEQLAHPLSGRLLAWAILSGRMDSEDFFPRRDQGMRFVADAIEARVRAQLGEDRVPAREDIEFGMLLVFSAALGYSFSRTVLWESLSKKPSAERDRWFREKLGELVTDALPIARGLAHSGSERDE
ncbi:TetR/AcrR family transcriptional regulator [Sandaracinus amylolyticus]|uniref:Transcriptional regulator, TetR family protein n=1 Tax=Sandaracinus amylolyticus TaxID=927083 RepID=A0A0F6W881_9BACT|nr:TetR/AcrR family transcriptional regulator [Sandaracinus amylolyticus]AKF09993.1 Transcriptional regulator, TetR family protein [Sandaracinus amylolyticus]